MNKRTEYETDSMTHLEQVWDDIENSSETNWDDLMEYDEKGLRDRYFIGSDEATLLWLNIQRYVDARRDVRSFSPSRIGHLINEALHQGLDGWTVEQGMVIQGFLADIAYSAWIIQEDERLAKLRGQQSRD